jgi:hypothetical protein
MVSFCNEVGFRNIILEGRLLSSGASSFVCRGKLVSIQPFDRGHMKGFAISSKLEVH